MDDWTGLDLPAAVAAVTMDQRWTGCPRFGSFTGATPLSTHLPVPAQSFICFISFSVSFVVFHFSSVVRSYDWSFSWGINYADYYIDRTNNEWSNNGSNGDPGDVREPFSQTKRAKWLPACLPAILTDCGWVIDWLTINARINDRGEMIGFRFGCRNYSNSEKINYIERHRPAGPIQCSVDGVHFRFHYVLRTAGLADAGKQRRKVWKILFQDWFPIAVIQWTERKVASYGCIY